MIRTFLWSVFVIGVIHCPAFAQGDDDELKKHMADLAKFAKGEADLDEKVRTAAFAGAKHVASKKGLDFTDKEVVKKYEMTRIELRDKLQAALNNLHEHRKLQIPPDDRIRLARLLKRKAHLDEEIRREEERVKKVQAFLKKLGDEAAKDSNELEAMIAMSEHASEAAYQQTWNVLLQIPSAWSEASKVLPKFNPDRYRGDDPFNAGMRKGILGLRKFDKFLLTDKGKEIFARISEGKKWFDKDHRLIPDKLDDVGRIGRDLDRDFRPHLEDLSSFREIIRIEGSITLRLEFGLPSMRVLAQACELLAVGSIAIESVGAAYEQHIACRELRKAGKVDAVTHLNAIIKSYTAGGAHFKAYKQDIDRLKSLRQERTHVEGEIQAIRTRLGKGGF